jgi:hypothetical protein
MAISGSGVVGGLGSFLRTFSGIRDEQAQRAEEKRRFEEQKAEEQRRYEALQKQQERDRLMQVALSMRQFGGAVDPQFASQIQETGLGHLLQETPGQVIPSEGPGSISVGGGYQFKQTPDEQFTAEDRSRANQTRQQIEALIAQTTDPAIKQRLQLALGGVNIPTDDLTPYDVRTDRAKDLAKFEHGLRMNEIGAQMEGRETPQERYLREIDRTELLSITDIAQRSDLMPDQQKAAIAQIQQKANEMRARVQGQGGPAAPAADPDLEDIKADFETLRSKAPNANPRAILSRMGKDAAAQIQDPAALRKYQTDLLRFALTLPEVANAPR